MIKINVLVFRTKQSKKAQWEYVTIPNTLQALYDLVECDSIDIVQRKIGDKTYALVVDDEGMFKEDCKISFISSIYDMLVGNIVFARVNSEGDLESISEDEAFDILEYKRTIMKGQKGECEAIVVS